MARASGINYYNLLNEIDDKSPFTIKQNHPYSEDNFKSKYDEEGGPLNWNRSAMLNEKYAKSLGWINHIYAINDLLLQATCQRDISLYRESFAQAVAAWQQQQALTADGVIGPNTWARMKPLLNLSRPPQPVNTTPVSTLAPSIQNIFDFNRWYAQKILDAIHAGNIHINTHLSSNPKQQLEKILSGQTVINVNPHLQIIQVLPLIYHICEQARINNYTDIMIGSFIRTQSGSSCTGHCAGRSIDINYIGGSFTKSGAVQMVRNILSYLTTLPAIYKKDLRFGLPIQGDFFGNKHLAKFQKTSPFNIIDSQTTQLLTTLGMVFPDNDNHLHIQLKWM